MKSLAKSVEKIPITSNKPIKKKIRQKVKSQKERKNKMRQRVKRQKKRNKKILQRNIPHSLTITLMQKEKTFLKKNLLLVCAMIPSA